MEFTLRDLMTIVGAVVSLTSLYFALKKSVDKLAAKVSTIESYHKREITAMNDTMSDYKKELNVKNDKLEGKIDAIQSQISVMSSALSELTGYLKAQKK
jgi:methyl-accepting chemotaxis protein